MSRVEELTFKLLDAEISDADTEELEQLLSDSAEARDEHLACCKLEAGLRGRLGSVDVAARVMAEIAAQPVSSGGETTRRRFRLLSLPWLRVAAAMVVLCGIGLLAHLWTRPPVTAGPPAFAGVRIANADPGVTVLSGGERRQATGELPLRHGDMVETAYMRVASLVYRDGTRIVLGPSTTATVGDPTGKETERKTIHLWHGTSTAHVAEQPEGRPLAITTPGAAAEVLGTRFRVSVDDAQTRVDVVEGKVKLTREADGASATVSRGQFAASAPTVEPVAAPQPPRVRDALVALYRFDEGDGGVAHDVSGVAPIADLTVDEPDALEWLDGGGVRFSDRAMFASSGPVTKLVDACVSSNEISVEAWISPSTTDQIGPARIVTLSGDTSTRDFTLGQDGSQESWPPPGGTLYSFRLRTTTTTENGTPPAETARGTVVADLMHVLYTRAHDGAAKIYIDGVERATHGVDGDFSAWASDFRIALGDEFTRDRPWLGTYHLVALYSRALSPDEVVRNFRAGPRG